MYILLQKQIHNMEEQYNQFIGFKGSLRHKEFLESYGKKTGNVSFLLRQLLDKHITEKEQEQKKIEQYNNLSK